MELVAIVGSCGTRLCHAPDASAHAWLMHPKWPPTPPPTPLAVGQCGQVGVVELFIIFFAQSSLPPFLCLHLSLFPPFPPAFVLFCFCGCFVFGSCPFLRLRHSRLFISNFISYEFVCFYRKTRRRVAAKHKQQLRPLLPRPRQPYPYPPLHRAPLKGYGLPVLF